MTVRSTAALALALCVALALVTPLFAADPAADALAGRVMDAVGADAWNSTPYVQFRFADRRSHWWDRFSGMHRLEGVTQKEGRPYVVVHDVHDEGSPDSDALVWLDGEPAPPEMRAELLQAAYGAWVNDTYWLAGPFKLMDPGVNRHHAGQTEVNGQTYDLLELTFGDVGLTPGDRYTFYVHPETGEIDRWAYVLQGQEPPATVWTWSHWQELGPPERRVELSGSRERQGGEETVVLTLTPMELPSVFPEGVWSSPEPLWVPETPE